MATDNTFKYKANLKRRIYATIIDYGFYFLFFYAYVSFFGHENNEGAKTVNGFLALPIFIVWFIYFVIIEALNGATFGHQIFDLKVLRLNRKEVEFPQALKRHLLDSIDIFFYGIPAIIAIKNSDKHQRIGDMWANTFIVNTKDPEQYLDKQATSKYIQ